MPARSSSQSARGFFTHVARASGLLGLSNDRRLRPHSRARSETVAHAALAALVGAWEAYVEHIVGEFYVLTAQPSSGSYASLHDIATALAHTKIEKFNTPNAENSRELLVGHTGYDPIGDWIWPAARMGGHETRLRLNEILKVRHSFAHGFSVPTYSWLTTPRGAVQVNSSSVRHCVGFFRNVVKRTDRGMSRHMRTYYGVRVRW